MPPTVEDSRRPRNPTELAARLLEVIEHEIAPITRTGVERGDKIFGAAILRKSDRSLVIAGTNEETRCPLWHGEVVAIRRFHELPTEERPAAPECLFLSTHEPCSLCLSAITWAGFDNFYYLFSYEDSRDEFAIPHDLKILDQVFDCPNGAYRSANDYWQSHCIPDLIAGAEAGIRRVLEARVERLRTHYAELSQIYQAAKGKGGIPLA